MKNTVSISGRFICLILFCLVLVLWTLPAYGADVFVEAEQFRDTGGWDLDQQCMDQMGSPYLLAHGLGVPVRDAVTTVKFPKAGMYHVWVRTRDWVAPWNASGAPGKFQVFVNGKPLATTFGTEGAEWRWQDGGMVEIAGEAKIALHDLTGFEGRCDALLFSSDSTFSPPNGAGELTNFRRVMLGLPDEPEDGGTYDLVVVGGGIAGTSAALSAARNGLKVALVQDRPVLGGNGSSEVRVWPEGHTRQKPYPSIGDIVDELVPAKGPKDGNAKSGGIYADERKLDLVRAEPRITLLTEQHVNAVEVREGRIQSVVAQHIRTGRRIRLAASFFADCTGDGTVGFLAGADYEISRENVMGASNLWNLMDTSDPEQMLRCECKDKEALAISVKTGNVAAPFPRCPWAIDLSDKPFPGRGNLKGQWGNDPLANLGGWFWESGFDKDHINDIERIRDLNFRAMYGAWDALKNVDKLYPNHRLGWAAFIAGKRESRRLLGDVVLTGDDFRKGREFADACFPCSWHIDLHSPDPAFAKGLKGDEFISLCTTGKEYSYQGPYWAPYRCLYSRNLTNLFMAGRDISVTHEALGPVRVMKTCGMMGEIVGKAAWISVRHQTTPRGVYEKHLPQLKELMTQPGAMRRDTLRGNLSPSKNIKPAASQSPAPQRDTNTLLKISGTYPSLAVFSNEGEIGIGAVAPWNGRLWFVTYPPHKPYGSEDKLWMLDANLTLTARSESVGGTHANRMVHRESKQLIIGRYFIDSNSNVQVVAPAVMPGRLTANARHLTDPADKVYFASMEEGFYEVDVHSLAVTTLKPDTQDQTSRAGLILPGNHGKGLYSGQGRLVYANNGETAWSVGSDLSGFNQPAGLLAENSGKDFTNGWTFLERNNFTEITGPGGIYGNNNREDPLWAVGWDKRSVLLKLLDHGVWQTFRLPKGSYTHDCFQGWFTEWPRIREIADGRRLMHMHGLFYNFPGTFSAADSAGIKPICTYLKMPVDYCWWNDQLVMGRDDSSTTGGNPWTGQSQSALWFGQLNDLKQWGPPSGFGGPWKDDTVLAKTPSDPFLVTGFKKRVLHIRHDTATRVNFMLQHDSTGHGMWRNFASIAVPANGYDWYILPPTLDAIWVRLLPDRAATNVTAFFQLANSPQKPSPELFAGLADASSTEPISDGIIRSRNRDGRTLEFAASLLDKTGRVRGTDYYEIDGAFQLRHRNNPMAEKTLRTSYSLSKGDFTIDAASVVCSEGTNRFRLPKSVVPAYDAAFGSGWPRGLREVVTERLIFNAHGTFYELPLSGSGGFRRVRPVATHNKHISDFASWRGLFVMTGVARRAAEDGHVFRSDDGQVALWFGDVDDIWRMGPPEGVGGPWKDTEIHAEAPSDPYLMLGYEHKVLALSHAHANPVTFTVEVDFAADNVWSRYARFTVPAGRTVKHVFPDGYNAHWVRIKSDKSTRATAMFVYGPARI